MQSLSENFTWASAEPYDSWIQVDFGEIKSVTGVATQGRPSHPQWTTSSKFSYSDNSQNWEVYKESDSEKVCVQSLRRFPFIDMQI